MDKIPVKKEGGIDVSDHAILRYLERVKGINIEEIKREIVPDKLMGVLSNFAHTDFKYKIKGSHTLIIKDRIVVTIIKRK